MKIYIAGPMTGIADYNFPAFHRAASVVRAAGHDPLNPATSFDGRQDLEYEFYIREAVRMVSMSDAILMLPGWSNSKGACMELHVALTIGLPTFFLSEQGVMEPTAFDMQDIGYNLLHMFYGYPDDPNTRYTMFEPIKENEDEDSFVGEDEEWEEYPRTADESDVVWLDYSLVR